MAGFGDEIMILEGFEDAVGLATTIGDVLNAIADFPPGLGDNLICARIKAEDGLDDVVGDLGRRGRRRRGRRHHRGRFRRRGFAPLINRGPIIVEQDPNAVSSTTVSNRRRILAMEKKLKELHPKKVDITSSGVEGFGVPFATSVTTQVGTVRQAATKPQSPNAKVIVKNLVAKGKTLANLAAKRRALSMNALRAYQGNKKTVDKLERVAKSKASTVLKTAMATNGKSSSPTLASKMNKEIKDTRRLRNRAIGVGQKAIQDMKLHSIASILADNAEAQSRASMNAAKAIVRGDLSGARAFSAEIAKHAQTARQLKTVRKRQVSRWTGQNKKAKMVRLGSRRMRAMKMISALQQKDRESGLTPRDKIAMRSAYAALQREEFSMLGLTDGAGISKKVRAKTAASLGDVPLGRLTVKDMEPVFAVTMAPTPKEGEWFTDSLGNLDALYVPDFSVKDPDRYSVAAGSFRSGIPGLESPLEAGLSGFDALFVPEFSVDDPKQAAYRKTGFWLGPAPGGPGGFGEPLAPFKDMNSPIEPTPFSVKIPPNDPAGAFLSSALGNLSESLTESSFGFMPMKLNVPSWSSLKKLSKGTIKSAEKSLSKRSKRVGNALKRRAKALWRFAHISSNVKREGRALKIRGKSRAADARLRRGPKYFRRKEKMMQKAQMAKFAQLSGFEPFSVPEAIMVDKDNFGDFTPFNVPESIWATRGFGDTRVQEVKPVRDYRELSDLLLP